MTVDTMHCHVDNLSRLKGEDGERSSVAKAAYNAGASLWNEREQRFSNFTYRQDIVLSEIFAPKGAPDWTLDREALWNRVEAFAKRRDARLAKSIDAAIPRAVARQNWRDMTAEFVEGFVALGMVADAAIHEDGTDHNPHVHVLLTVNALKPEGFGQKIVLADAKSFLTQVRRDWERICNKYLAASGSPLRVDGRSYRARGLAQTPTKHRGPNPLERRARRAHAKRIREEQQMASPTADERHQYRHITQHAGWPFAEGRPAEDFTPEQRGDFDRLMAARLEAARQDSERAAEERHVPEWFAEKLADADARGAQHEELSDPDWYKKGGEESREHPPEWRQPALDDFEQSRLDEELQARHVAYEKDLFQRAVLMNRTRQEQDLITRAKAVSPEMENRVKDILFDRRIQTLREADDAKRLQDLEDRLGPALQQDLAEYLDLRDLEADTHPVPGPYGDAERPSDLDRAQARMLEEYHRDHDEPER